MLTETPIYKMNEATYSRIALAHAEVGCSPEILPTVLKLDVFFPGHTISFESVLQYLRTCSNCNLQCDYFVERGYGHPYVDLGIVEKYGQGGYYTGQLPTVPETTSNAAHYLHMLSNTVGNKSTDKESDIDFSISNSQYAALWYDHTSVQSASLVQPKPCDMYKFIDRRSTEVYIPPPGWTPPEISMSARSIANRESAEINRLRHLDFLNTVNNSRELLGKPKYVTEEFLNAAKLLHVCDNDEVPTTDVQYMDPWSDDLKDEEAPEEDETPSPHSFDIPLSYMNKTIAEATQDFYQMIETRVSASLRESSDIVIKLKHKYLRVFVPHDWTGITGIDPIVIEVTGDLPPFKKPRARPINPKMMTKAHEEFKRLLGYFYVPSNSP
jgi:hypothetical protein